MKGFAKSVSAVEEYYFSKKLKEVNRLIQEGKPIINMGIGSPDLAPHPTVVDALKHTASQGSSHGYQGYQGIFGLRKAVADFYKEHYAVILNPDAEILPLMGSKEGIMHVTMTFLEKGDGVLVPDPGYPTYSSVSKLMGIKVHPYVLNAANGWYPDFEALEKQDLSNIKLMWCNYPHMPSGAKADLSVFEKLVKFAQKHNLVLVHDNPYSFILENEPKSIFQIEGAKDVALELNSLSKSSNMAGWRVGMLLGRKDWIQAVTKVKSNMDSGMFLGLQKGAIEALSLGADWYTTLNEIYVKRRELVWELASKMELEFEKESAGMFVWAKLPENMTAMGFVDKMLYEKDIFLAPGDIFGKNGLGYVRFSLCLPEEKIQEAISRI
ncbi:MAG: aminotransferase class I/II-fold pyridoxal phosphate-dependent enzyme [Mongoliibacter sp.]|uniref:pyridoxal phosphate-dependent aminotransferase n=1 Tax=Mongoliibacter sp. TaxID=2022438 RepID=UPI0012F0CA5A|nr:aminotransferase class I/II-fold pyridoxal phosphate-dependent enzyme [Mongoliibacter sp.]TVP48126.1 MAG: aminotransferase class I/II-fold pyridoxal phosphate-dependent enzyme [Mongoliibacter sp.]